VQSQSLPNIVKNEPITTGVRFGFRICIPSRRVGYLFVYLVLHCIPIHASLMCQNPRPSIHPVSALDPLHPDIFTWVDGIKYSCTTTLTITRTATAYIGGSSFVADTITWTIDSVTGSTVEIVTYRFPAATVSSFLATQAIKLVSPIRMLMSVVFRYWTYRYCLPDTVVVQTRQTYVSPQYKTHNQNNSCIVSNRLRGCSNCNGSSHSDRS
jgi:hypothetical protein